MKLFHSCPFKILAFSVLAAAFSPASYAQSGSGTETLPLERPVEGIEVSGTLPVCYINTENGEEITSKENYLKAEMWIDPMNTDFEACGSKENPLTLQIRGRGNSSWNSFGKKPYRLKLDSKAEILGMPKSKHFGLISHAPTHLYIQNASAFQTARLMELGWVPRNQPVEVVLNGTNLGVYSFSELVKVDKNRLDMPEEQPDNNEDEATIGNGWLVEIDNTYDTPQIIVPQPAGEGYGGFDGKFTIKVPEELSAMQEDWITRQMTAITESLYDYDAENPEWLGMIDLESFAKYYIVQEITCNYDAFSGSTYIHNADGGKWTFGPIWDSEWSYEPDERKAPFWIERTVHNPGGGQAFHVWIRQAMHYPQFLDEVKRVWKEYYPQKLEPIFGFIDNFYAEVCDAYEVNAKIWPDYNAVNIDQAYYRVKTHARKYMEWFDSYVNSPAFSGIESVGETSGTDAEWYTIQGMRLGSEPAEKGIYIRVCGGKATKVVK